VIGAPNTINPCGFHSSCDVTAGGGWVIEGCPGGKGSSSTPSSTVFYDQGPMHRVRQRTRHRELGETVPQGVEKEPAVFSVRKQHGPERSRGDPADLEVGCLTNLGPPRTPGWARDQRHRRTRPDTHTPRPGNRRGTGIAVP
jgi:hypothetical protein